MKPKIISMMGAVLGLLVALSSTAAERGAQKSGDGRLSAQPHQPTHSLIGEQPGRTVKAGDILGVRVKNPQDEALGKVGDLGVDLESGRIVHVVVSTGGFLGIRDRTVAVPPGAFTWDAANKTMRLSGDKETLKAAPEFNVSKWEESNEMNRIAEAYRYFGQTPYFAADAPTDPPSSAPAGKLGYIEKATSLIGKTVKNTQGEKLGHLDHLILDLGAGYVAQTILSSGEYLEAPGELSPVPPTVYRYTDSRDMLVLDQSKEDLAKAPRFKSTGWPDFNEPKYIANVCAAYGVQPYFNASPASSIAQRAIPGLPGSRPEFAEQALSASDVETSRRIRQQILDHDGLSAIARTAKITTVNGRVILRGVVSSEDEKRLLAEIACRMVQPANVENQLEVKPDAKGNYYEK